MFWPYLDDFGTIRTPYLWKHIYWNTVFCENTLIYLKESVLDAWQAHPKTKINAFVAKNLHICIGLQGLKFRPWNFHISAMKMSRMLSLAITGIFAPGDVFAYSFQICVYQYEANE